MTAEGPRAKECAHVWFHWHSDICQRAGYANGLADAQVAAMREVADMAARITQLESQLAAAKLALAACADVRAARRAAEDT